MSNNQIQTQLEELYQDYKNHGYKLNEGKTKKVSQLLVKMTNTPDYSSAMIAEELARFSGKVTFQYFVSVSRICRTEISMIDEILSALMDCDNDPTKTQVFIQRYLSAVKAIMEHCQESALHSGILPVVVLKIAKSVKTEKQKQGFQSFVAKTDGSVFLLDYAHLNEKNLNQFWKIINEIYPDISKSGYADIITDWAKKYDFLKENVSEQQEISAPVPERPQSLAAPESVLTEKKISAIIRQENETIKAYISEHTQLMQKLADELRKELNICCELTRATVSMQSRIQKLEDELKETKAQVIQHKKIASSAEHEKTELQNKIQQLDLQLKEAYSLNSHEDSMETEKLKNDLSKSLTFCYEDWQEYQNSVFCEENYESLQAIIKRMFRTIEKNGIVIKGNQQ